MSTAIEMREWHVDVEADWSLARETALERYQEQLDPAIPAWFEDRQLDIEIDAELVHTDIAWLDVTFEFRMKFVFDKADDAMLFKLTFGGSESV